MTLKTVALYAREIPDKSPQFSQDLCKHYEVVILPKFNKVTKFFLYVSQMSSSSVNLHKHTTLVFTCAN